MKTTTPKFLFKVPVVFPVIELLFPLPFIPECETSVGSPLQYSNYN